MDQSFGEPDINYYHNIRLFDYVEILPYHTSSSQLYHSFKQTGRL